MSPRFAVSPLASCLLFFTVHLARADDAPQFFGARPGALVRAKARLAAGDAELLPALKKLVADADRDLKLEPPSVMEKAKPGPSGDKHDYFSLAIYFWPNPNTSDGLPYIRKDGHVNPESHGSASDSPQIGKMAGSAETLALAYYFTGNSAYAEHAAKLLRVWFLDPATRMNPNFDYSQAVPGKNTGRGTGMIESRTLQHAADAASLLAGSPAWPRADDDAFRAWLKEFLNWARTSSNGRAEHNAKNNHGSFYDAQIAHFALAVGDKQLAREILEGVGTRRVAVQIKPDGSQPLELARADSFGYSRFNVEALFECATLGEHVGVDLWHFETKEGASLCKALDFLLPYAEDESKPWPYEHDKKASRGSLAPELRRAWIVYDDERYRKALEKFSGYEKERDALLFAK